MKLEHSLNLGIPVLIEMMGEEIKPLLLERVVFKEFLKSGNEFKVQFGDKQVFVSKDFMLYMTCKFSNPTYSPGISARVVLLNFSVTVEGLTD